MLVSTESVQKARTAATCRDAVDLRSKNSTLPLAVSCTSNSPNFNPQRYGITANSLPEQPHPKPSELERVGHGMTQRNIEPEQIQPSEQA